MDIRTPEQVEAEVGHIMRRLYESVGRVDFGAWMGILHDPPGKWHLGMDVVDIREASKRFEADWTSVGESRLERQEIDDLEIHVVPISPTVAYALCTSPDRKWCFADGRVDRAGTAETWVFVLTSDGWKLHSGQSAIFPLEE
jgi:hypothetical protein